MAIQGKKAPIDETDMPGRAIKSQNMKPYIEEQESVIVAAENMKSNCVWFTLGCERISNLKKNNVGLFENIQIYQWVDRIEQDQSSWSIQR